MNETIDKNNQSHTKIHGLLQTLDQKEMSLVNYVETYSETMNSQAAIFVEQTEKQISLNNILERNLEKVDSINDSQEQILESYTKSLELSAQSNHELSTIVESMKENANSQLFLQKELDAAMNLILQEKTNVGDVVTNLNNQLMTQLADMDERIQHLSEVWESTSSLFTTANKQLGTSMNQFTDDMHRGLEHTFKQFDDELAKSVKYLSQAVHAIHEGIIDLPDSIEILNKSVNELNKHAKAMLKTL